jgi:copper chaperone
MCDSHTELTLTDVNSGCACGTHDHAGATPAAVTASAASGQYLVEGMTCSHCVASVTEELSGIAGVEDVTVDLRVGGASVVTVASAAPLAEDQVRAAVEEAGYTLAVR